MSLLDIRRLFVESSGRSDLVVDTTTYADAGANWFIQAGQRYLDRMLDEGNARTRYFGKLEYSRNVMKLPRARVVEKVFRSYPDGKSEITRSLDPSTFVNDTVGVPSEYSSLIIRPVVASEYGLIPGIEANISFQDPSFQGLSFNLLADKDYGIEIIGLFYSPDLLVDTDKSFWSEEHPEILVGAAFLTMERFYRNFEGLKECRASVEDMVQQLDFDYVAQQIVHITKLEG